MAFFFRTAFWFSLVLAFVPPGFQITPDHDLYAMVLELLPGTLSEAVQNPTPVSKPIPLCETHQGLCDVSAELGVFLDLAGQEAERRLPSLTPEQ